MDQDMDQGSKGKKQGRSWGVVPIVEIWITEQEHREVIHISTIGKNIKYYGENEARNDPYLYSIPPGVWGFHSLRSWAETQKIPQSQRRSEATIPLG